jgi:hypothetical protein
MPNGLALFAHTPAAKGIRKPRFLTVVVANLFSLLAHALFIVMVPC